MKIFGRIVTICIIGLAVFGYWKKYGNRIPTCPHCNVIVISLDQVRAKSLPCFGYTQNTAPNLCAFAEKSHVFTNAYTTASRTHDAHFSMVTGLYPSVHTMTLPYASTLPAQVSTLAELMKEQGYGTYFFGPVGDPHLPLQRGMERGFDRTFDADNPDAWIVAMDQIATSSGTLKKPAFYFMHTYAAHEPYMPSPEDLKLFYDGPEYSLLDYETLCKNVYLKLSGLRPDVFETTSPAEKRDYCDVIEKTQATNVQSYEEFNDLYGVFNDTYWHQFDALKKEDRARLTHALYAAQIRVLDTWLGRFFDYLDGKKLLETTMVIIVGDQGDEFFEHGSYSHGWSLYDEVLHVPFIVYVPRSGSSVSKRLTSIVDILPTVFQVVEKKMQNITQGYSVFSDMTHSMIISEHASDGALKIQTDQYSMIRRINGDELDIELYDRKIDPGELQNIFADHANVAKALFREYEALKKQFPVYSDTKNPLPTWMKEEDRKNLINSGYF